MKKKLLAVLLVMVMVVPLILSSVYANNYPVPNLDPTSWETDRHREILQVAVLVYNGENQAALDKTLWEGGLTYLSVREIVEGLGLHIHYVADTRSIYIVDSENATHAAAEKAEEGTFNLFRNDTKVDADFKIVDNVSYVSAETLAAALGLNYYEDIRTNSVYFFEESAPLKDGVYTVADVVDSRGWAPQIDITVEGGKITAVTYNEYNTEDGRGKKTDEVYNTNWKNTYPEADLAAAIDSLEAQLLAGQTVASVDAVSGATSASEKFITLTGAAIAKAQTEKAVEDRIVALGGEVVEGYKDGKYVIIGLEASNGWTPQVDLVVEDGKITEVVYNAFNADGEGKREDGAGYLTNWTSRYPDVDPVAIIEQAEIQLIKSQDPNLVDVATGATSWSNDLKRFAAGALYHAARADVEITDDSTIYVFVGDSTAHSAYYGQLLAVAEDDVVTALDYIEFQRGTPIAKQHNPTYVGETGNWWQNYSETTLGGRMPLEVRAEMTAYALENKTYTTDTITGATNWGYGFEQLVPRAFEYIEGK